MSSAFHHHVHDRSVKPDVGPELRALGASLAYDVDALAAVAAHYNRHGTTEGLELVHPADVGRIDRAATADWLARYEAECNPAEWPEWTDSDRWEPTEPTEEDRQWAAETADVDAGVFASV
jgi:hypothetical protein